MTVGRRMRPVMAVGAMSLAMAGLALTTSVLAAFAAPAQAPRFVALEGVQQGLWQLKEVGGATRPMCVRDPTALFQLRSRGAGCSRFVVENGPTSATVHYTCPGRGHGRTTISVETPRLMHVASEGMENGAPFSIEFEGRRTGECPAG